MSLAPEFFFGSIFLCPSYFHYSTYLRYSDKLEQDVSHLCYLNATVR